MSNRTRPRDYPLSRGAAAIGSRLRRLSERIDRDVELIYEAIGTMFEPRWFGVLNQLDLHPRMSVGDLAAALGVTHASVSQVRTSLARAQLITWSIDPTDARSRKLELSAKGKALVRKLRPLWNALETVAIELDREAGRVIPALDRLDRALDRVSLFDRAAGAIEKHKRPRPG